MNGYPDSYIFSPKTFSEPASRVHVKRRIPGLTRLETRMHHAIATQMKKRNLHYLRKQWLRSKTKSEVVLLIGTGRYNTMSGDINITFDTKVIKSPATYDPLAE